MLKKLMSRFAVFIAVKNPQKRFKMAKTAMVIIIFAYLFGIVEALILRVVAEDLDFLFIDIQLFHPSVLITSIIPLLVKFCSMLGEEGGSSGASNTEICIWYISVAMIFLLMYFIAWIKMRKRKIGWAIFVYIGYTLELMIPLEICMLSRTEVTGGDFWLMAFMLLGFYLPKIILTVIIWRGITAARYEE